MSDFAIDPANTAQTDPRNSAGLRDAEEINAQPVVQGLAGYVMKCWQAARWAKRPITEQLMEAQRQRRGVYSPELQNAIKEFGGSEEYGRVTTNKCRIANAWLRDVYLGQTEKPWTIIPELLPEVPPEDEAKVRLLMSQELAQTFMVTGQAPEDRTIKERMAELQDAVEERIKDDARDAAERMEARMDTQLDVGGFHRALGEFLDDFVTYKAAHIKGPIFRKKSKVEWKQQPTGAWAPISVEEIIPEFERIDPFRAYPAPLAVTPQDQYFIHHITLERKDLYELIGVVGFSEEAIRAVLQESEGGKLSDWLGLTDWKMEKMDEGTFYLNNPMTSIDALEFHGPVSGRDLISWGMDEDLIDDVDKDYDACVWVIGRWVIKAQLNGDPYQRRPIHKACWEEIPGMYWGQGLPDSLADVQGVVNAAIRALVNNMAIASGPQVVVNVDRLPPGENITQLHPWGIWQVQDSQFGGNEKAVEFYQPSMNTQELTGIIDKFYEFADTWSLLPRYMGGSDKMGEVGRTASGLSMLFSAANKGLKGIVSVIDERIMTPMLGMLYAYNMIYDEDDTIKGDANILARGAISLMQLETLQLRRNEFLQSTANPIDSQIVGIDGRRAILREVAKGLEMDINKVVPPDGAPQPTQVAPNAPQGGQPQGQPSPPANGEQLQNGAAVTDNFSPNTMRSA